MRWCAAADRVAAGVVTGAADQAAAVTADTAALCVKSGNAALLRGGYHLYQGVGAGLGNLVMGLVYGRWYQATHRLWPLVFAHALIDTVAFVGYAVLVQTGVIG